MYLFIMWFWCVSFQINNIFILVPFFLKNFENYIQYQTYKKQPLWVRRLQPENCVNFGHGQHQGKPLLLQSYQGLFNTYPE